mmetsp:Transcript_80692/g.227051  ORF Transcript_80692/g.227051 Transcript_80692/m.227051 type:complete len:116 (-) Transcript_80692:21-368(-)
MALTMQDLFPKQQRRVKVQVHDDEEEVEVDPDHGPLLLQGDGTTKYFYRDFGGSRVNVSNYGQNTPWLKLSKTEREVMIITCAKRNRAIRATTAARGPPGIIFACLFPGGKIPIM